MIKKGTSVRDKINALRRRFAEQLPARTAQARLLFEAWRLHPADQDEALDLGRFLHNIKGTAKSFGLATIGVAAETGEARVEAILALGPAAGRDLWLELEAQLDVIERFQPAETSSSEQARMASNTPLFQLAETNHAEPEGHGRTVYICDDEHLLLEQLGAQLACFGFKVSVFSDTTSLLEAVAARRPDVLVMDIVFPDANNAGLEAVTRINVDLARQIPTVFLSARNDFDARLRAVQAGGEAYFHKPVAPMDLVATLDALTVDPLTTQYRVLVVDDEPEVAALHGLILEEAGMLTRQVNDPLGVLEALQDFRPDIVLMDLYMPGCSGRDLAKMIRQLPDYFSLPIVYLSSETDKRKQFSALRVGAEGFLIKPIQAEDLVSAVAIRAERMRSLRALMARDSLTGLYNHSTILQMLDSALARARRDGSQLSFCMIDVDHFKSVNDNYGHQTGDQVLLALARVLRQRLRSTDLIGRYGGEEFCVVLDGIDPEAAKQVIDQLRIGFSKVLFHAGDADFCCTFSAGVASAAQYPAIESLCDAADKLMYEAKHAGRNRVFQTPAPGPAPALA